MSPIPIQTNSTSTERSGISGVPLRYKVTAYPRIYKREAPSSRSLCERQLTHVFIRYLDEYGRLVD